MDDATVLHACRLLHEALCDDLELRQLTVDVKRDRVSLTIHSKRGRQESKVVVGATENVRLLDDWRTLARNGRNLKPSPHIKTASCFGKLRGVGAMSDDLYTLIGYQVEVTADWRRRQAEYFPHDDRNARAAKELERLAGEVDQLEGSSVHEQIRLATDRLKNEDWFAMSKSVYAELRSVGFDSTYESGLQFLEWYCDRLRGEMPRCRSAWDLGGD
jgi:hypothetical protein